MADLDLAAGLEPGHRFRCTTCGNLTRFDVQMTERTRGYHHFSLGGEREVQDLEVLERRIERVSCRWCSNETVVAEAAPVGEEPPAP